MKTIFELIKTGSLEEIKTAIGSDKTLAKAKDFKKRNLIMLASQRGDEEIFNYLISQKAPFKGSDKRKNTALHYAMEGSNFNIIKALIDKKIKKEQLNEINETAITLINKNTSPEILELLLKGEDLNKIYEFSIYKGNLLYFVVMRGNLDLLKFILNKGIELYNDDYFYKSLENKSIEMAKYLISKGFDTKLTEKQLINLFSRNNDFELIKFIVTELKVDISKNIIIDSFDELNIVQHYIDEYYLANDKKLEIVKFLIENGGDINYVDHGKRDAMYLALINNNLEIADLLLKSGSSLERLEGYLINLNDYYFDKLRKSIRIPTIKFIINTLKNIDLNMLKESLLAAMTTNNEIIDNFLSYDTIEDLEYFINTFNLDIQKEYFKFWGGNYNIFTRAILLNQIEKVKWFLKIGVDINKIDSNDNPPIYYSLGKRDKSVTDLLKLLAENNVDLNIKVEKEKHSLLLASLLKEGYYPAKFLFESGLKLELTASEYFKLKTYSNGNIDIPPFNIIKLLIDNRLELDTSETEILNKVLLKVVKKLDDLLYLTNRYNIDLNTLDSYYLKRILEYIIKNPDLTKEENILNFQKFSGGFNINTLSNEMKTVLINTSVSNIENFKLLEKEFEINFSNKDVLKSILINSIDSACIDTLNYILSKDIVIYDIYDEYKETLRLAKKKNKDKSYLKGYEERAENFMKIPDILKKYDKNIQKSIKKGDVEEKKEEVVKLTEEDKIIQKLDSSWIDISKLPKLYFKTAGELSTTSTLMLLSAVKNFGSNIIVLEQLDGITDDSILELFKYLKSEAPSKKIWIYDLLYILAESDVSIFTEIEKEIESYGYSGGYHLQNQLINKLTEINNIEGIKFIYKLTKSKRNSIKNSANNAFRNKSYLLGVSLEELKDMLISDFGLNSNKELNLDYGARTITVKLMPDFKLIFTDKAINKTYKSLPKASKTDDVYKVDEVAKFIKKMKKEVKKIVSDMRSRLKLQFIDPKFSKFSYWEQLFVKNPVLNSFATNIFWGIYKNEKLEKVFIYTTDGSYLDLEQNEITLSKDDLISIVHPVDLTEEELLKAKEFIDDYELVQPIKQINRQIFEAKDEEATLLTDFNKKVVKSNTFHYGLTNAGFSRGMVEDNGTIFTYRMDVKNIEILVAMSGITLGFYDNEDLEIADVIFRKNGDDMELEKVNKRVFSEVYLSLQLL